MTFACWSNLANSTFQTSLQSRVLHPVSLQPKCHQRDGRLQWMGGTLLQRKGQHLRLLFVQHVKEQDMGPWKLQTRRLSLGSCRSGAGKVLLAAHGGAPVEGGTQGRLKPAVSSYAGEEETSNEAVGDDGHTENSQERMRPRRMRPPPLQKMRPEDLLDIGPLGPFLRKGRPQNVTLPAEVPYKERKGKYGVSVEKAKKEAKKMRKVKEVVGTLPKPKAPIDGTLVPELIPVAHDVLRWREAVIAGCSELLKRRRAWACSCCPEVSIAREPHDLATCQGPGAGKRRSRHSWAPAVLEDILVPVDCYHLPDYLGPPISHDRRFGFERVPAVVELCVQAGVEVPGLETVRREEPLYLGEGDTKRRLWSIRQTPRPPTLPIAAEGLSAPSVVFNPLASVPVKGVSASGAREREAPGKANGEEDLEALAKRTLDAYIWMRNGIGKLISKYPARACGYCPEVQVGVRGHKVRLCGAERHQQRRGQHGWRSADIDDLLPPNFVWHVREPEGPPLANSLKQYYGQAPAIVELCVQAGADPPAKYHPMMRLDVVIPEEEEVGNVV